MSQTITVQVLREALDYDPTTGVFTRVDSGRPCATARWAGKAAGSITHNGYVMISIRGMHCQAHRLAWLWMTGSYPTDDVDHINGVRSDNSFTNLRVVDRRTNLQNQRAPSKNSTSGLLGVSPKRGRFQARIMVDRKTIRLGVFDTAQEAHAAYVTAKRQLHGGCTL